MVLSCSAPGSPLSPLLLGRLGLRDIFPGEASAPASLSRRHGCTLPFLLELHGRVCGERGETLFISGGGWEKLSTCLPPCPTPVHTGTHRHLHTQDRTVLPLPLNQEPLQLRCLWSEPGHHPRSGQLKLVRTWHCALHTQVQPSVNIL